MQLFSIGLIKLSPDGTPLRDDAGRTMDTYTNDDIVTFSRAWTGHDLQPRRLNVEVDQDFLGQDGGGDNYIDPMRLRPAARDSFPKLDLHGGYIGDGFPLCADLPDRGWLRQGAKFLYRGPSLTPELEESFTSFLTLDDSDSDLFRALCNGRDGGTGRCALQSVVRLNVTLPCHRIECEGVAPRLFRLVGAGNLSAFFEWDRPACVEFAFYNDAKVIVVRICIVSRLWGASVWSRTHARTCEHTHAHHACTLR